MWMVWVKRIFAVAMLGAAQYYLIQMGRCGSEGGGREAGDGKRDAKRDDTGTGGAFAPLWCTATARRRRRPDSVRDFVVPLPVSRFRIPPHEDSSRRRPPARRPGAPRPGHGPARGLQGADGGRRGPGRPPGGPRALRGQDAGAAAVLGHLVRQLQADAARDARRAAEVRARGSRSWGWRSPSIRARSA
jgi:hypothetical protein